MTRDEEIELLDNLERIRDETHENNIMLKQLCNYFASIAANADNENINDFGRNIIANIISTQFELTKKKGI